jgi:hypothetical protein
LSQKQKNKLSAWLECYRKIYPNWWNYLDNTVVDQITHNVPVTIDELAALEGVYIISFTVLYFISYI